MPSERTDYSQGTYLTRHYPWGLFSTPGKALCTDGKVRALARISTTADTYFSVPAAVKVTSNGERKTVAGFVSLEEDQNTSEIVALFTAYSYGKNGHLLPGIHRRD